ncbi:MAG: hypothetical protein JNK50_08880 [Bacteroidia bacterium]|nr:hypothetical protein [Bacteroidia bacterium]
MPRAKLFIIIALAFSSFGFILKLLGLPGGSLSLIIGLYTLSFTAFVQMIMSFFKLKELAPVLIILSVLMNFTLFFCSQAVLLRYMWWPGWQTLYVFGLPLFLLITIFLVVMYSRIKTTNFKVYFQKNLILPWFYIFVFGAFPVIVSYKTFYQSFNGHRQTQNYEQYIDSLKKLN